MATVIVAVIIGISIKKKKKEKRTPGKHDPVCLTDLTRNRVTSLGSTSSSDLFPV